MCLDDLFPTREAVSEATPTSGDTVAVSEAVSTKEGILTVIKRTSTVPIKKIALTVQSARPPNFRSLEIVKCQVISLTVTIFSI